MKNILYGIIVVLVSGLIGWFGHDWYQKKTMPEPELTIKTDTIIQTITDKVIDTVKIKESVYIPREVIKEVTKYDTVYFEKEQMQSKYSFNPEPFSIQALCYADCIVDSVNFSYYPNTEYFHNLGLKFYQEGYMHGQYDYPAWKKWAYFGAGVVGTIAVFKTAGK